MKKAIILTLIIGVAGAQKAQAELKVGDDAPAIHIKEWVKGEAFDMSKMKEKDVAVIEFWATWCGPCRMSIPHMSEMQDHFKGKGVTIIGVTDEDKGIITKFLKDGGWDAKMRYHVAIDNSEKTSDAYMKASGQQGIPTAFIVQGGKIKWIGHPMDGLGLRVAELVGDEAFAKKEKEKAARQEKINEIMGKFQMAAMGEDWAKANQHVGEALALDPDNFSLKLAKYHLTAVKLKDTEGAAKYGREILAKTEDVDSLNEFSWAILTHEDFEGIRDLMLAKDIASKALKASNEKDPSVIDTYSRALAETGDLAGAVQWQKKAVEMAEGPMKRDLEKSLKDFEERLKKQEA